MITMDERKVGSRRSLWFSVLIIGIIIMCKELFRTAVDMDEIWNYDLARGISMGLIPYRDFNMVMMPLFHWLFCLPLKISRTLLVYRIVSAVWLTAIITAFYKIAAKRVGHDAALLLSIVSAVLLNLFTYNSLFFLFAMCFYIVWEKATLKKRCVFLGAIALLSALSRQTSGSFLLLSGAFIVIGCSDRDKRTRAILEYIAGVGIAGIIFLIYLFVTGSFAAFWEYCFFALLQGDGNSTFDMSSVPALIISASGIAADIISYRKDRKKEDLTHLIVGLNILTVSIPIVDQLHMVCSGMWFAIPLMDILLRKTQKFLSVRMIRLLSCGAAAFAAIMIYFSFGGSYVDDIDELKYVPVPGDIGAYKDIADINALYEEAGYNVTILSQDAAMFSVIEGDFDPPYDLFLKGNLGMHDPMEYVQSACDDPADIILIPDNYSDGWENPEGVYEYVTAHCHPIYSYSQYVWYMPD